MSDHDDHRPDADPPSGAWHELVPADAYLTGRWEAARRDGITASEIATVLGINPWSSPWELWHRKRGLLDPWEGSDAAEWGLRLEPVIVAVFAERHPEFVARAVGLCASMERPWQMATPDRVLIEAPGGDREPVAVLEVKTTDSWDGWGDPGSGDIPAHYRAQVLWQADVLGVGAVYVAALARGKDYREYEVVVDDAARADIALMRRAAVDFLALDSPPPLDAHPATTAALKALHPTVDNIDVEVPRDLADEYDAARDAVAAAEARRAEVENRLRHAIGDGRRAVCEGRVIVTRSVYERAVYDYAALRRDHPDLIKRYEKPPTVVATLRPPAAPKERSAA